MKLMRIVGEHRLMSKWTERRLLQYCTAKFNEIRETKLVIFALNLKEAEFSEPSPIMMLETIVTLEA